MRIIGIDPGLTGALAVLGPSGSIELLVDLPVIRIRKLAWIDGRALRDILITRPPGSPTRAYVELVHAMPKTGSAGGFSQGCTLGSILATLQTMSLPIELIAPATWKRALGLITTGTKLTDTQRKRASLDKARLTFPLAELGLAKHHGRAEALLIALYARERAPRSA